MVFCAAFSSEDSRKRSASMERMPVAALFLLGGGGGREDGAGVTGNNAGFKLERLHDGLERFANFGSEA